MGTDHAKERPSPQFALCLKPSLTNSLHKTHKGSIETQEDEENAWSKTVEEMKS